MQFEWDATKAEINLRKHGVSFDYAEYVFYDPQAIVEQDRIEGREYRWRTIGRALGRHILVVAWVMRDEFDEEIIRIISARRAEPRERRRYERENR